MKNLKKLLALVLVAVMVLSFGAIGASAAFTDTASSPYQEAIDVLSGIGVINGTTPTTYNPTGSLTRAAAAKVITYMLLGPTNAALISTASSQKFSDVPTSHWASGYIEYCESQNIIAGTGDGTFNPEGVLTTIAFSKMLLVALGYNADIEGYVGSNWAVNIAADALTAGISDSRIPLSTTATCTREQAAQLAFKTLTAKTVQYTGGTTITIGESTITTGASRHDVANNAATETITDDDLMQFAERYYGGLTKVVVPMDDFGRPGTVNWKNNNKVIATVLPVATKTYTTAVTDGKIFTDLGLTASITADTYTDGKQNSSTLSIDYNGVDSIGGAGAVTEVYYDAFAGTIKIVVINTYFGSVTAVAAATAITPANVTVAKGTVFLDTFASGTFNTTGFAINDKVLYTVAKIANAGDASDYVVKSVAAPTKVTLTPTSYVAATSFTAGGQTYTYSAKLDSSTVAGFTAQDVYLDSYGYVINVEGAVTVANYAVVIAAGSSSDGLGGTTYNVKLLMTDGTQKVVTAAASATGLVDSIVTYTVHPTTGVYTLADPVTIDYAEDTVTPANDTLALALTQGRSAFVWTADDATSPAAGTATTFYGNTNTVYLVRTGSAPYTYTAYTGFANVPSMTGAAVGQVVVTNGFASVVYITDATVSGTASTGTVYLTGTYSTTVDAVKGTYYTSNAIVNGTPTTIDLASAPTKGLYTGVTYDANGVGTIGSGATVSTATGTKAAANGVIGLASGYYSYAADCAVYYISTVSGTSILTGVGSVSSIPALLTDANDTVIYTANAAGVVTSIYVEVVA